MSAHEREPDLRARHAPGLAAAEAEPILRECLAIQEKALPDGHAQQWLRFNTMSLLGGALVAEGVEGLRGEGVPATAGREGSRGQGVESALARFREAEPLLLDGYNGMKDDPRVPTPAQAGGDRKREALKRIVKLYEAWDAVQPGQGYDAKAAGWRAKLEALSDEATKPRSDEGQAATQPAP